MAEENRQNAQGNYIAQADRGGPASVNVGYTFEQVEALVRAGTQELKSTYLSQVDDLSQRLEVTRDALISFFEILKREQVPLEKLPQTLAEIAERHREMLARLAVLNPEDPAIKALLEEAQTAIAEGDYDRADLRLHEAETADLAAARQAQALAQQAQEAADQRHMNAAAARAERGQISLNRLHYLEAAAHFQTASEWVSEAHYPERGKYLRRSADALERQGDEKGDNAALRQAISRYQQALGDLTRERVPLDWAMTQTNLGTALARLGERESDTARLEEAVRAYREALQEYTRERVPLQWAMTQNNLARAYQVLTDWANAAAVYQELLDADPMDRAAYGGARFLYGERLFQFDKAFVLDQQWLARNPNDLDAQADFAEAHFTTGRFAEAHPRLTALLSRPEPTPQVKLALHALDLAALLALAEIQAIPAQLASLQKRVAAWPDNTALDWSFGGTRHFIRQQNRLASHPWLDVLLAALQAGDRAAARAALEQAQVALGPAADPKRP